MTKTFIDQAFPNYFNDYIIQESELQQSNFIFTSDIRCFTLNRVVFSQVETSSLLSENKEFLSI